MRVLGTRRSASHPDNDLDQLKVQPTRARRRLRLVLRIAMVLGAVILAFAAGIGLLFLLTPSAGEATALAAAQAREHHIAYPGPPVPQYFAEALVATEDHRFYADPGVDPLALVRV
ncbi:MAG TPA: transglycosylase domain-containing protein, partial [Streptosporangiaceae bacterium]|nr:transglycosylase domain-containing protein [Streptosporangiaceae bacterium]